MPPKRKPPPPPSKNLRVLFGCQPVVVRQKFEPPPGYSNNYSEWTKEELARLGIPQTAKAYIIQQCNYRGFTHFSNVKKERMVRVIQKFDELEAADDAKGRLTTLRDLQTQAEAEEPAAISEPLAPPLPDSNMLTPNHQDPSIRELEERLSCYIASVKKY